MTIKEDFENLKPIPAQTDASLLEMLGRPVSNFIYNFFAKKMKEIITEVYTQAPKDVAKWVDENIQEDWESYKSKLLQDLFDKYGLN